MFELDAYAIVQLQAERGSWKAMVPAVSTAHSLFLHAELKGLQELNFVQAIGETAVAEQAGAAQVGCRSHRSVWHCLSSGQNTVQHRAAVQRDIECHRVSCLLLQTAGGGREWQRVGKGFG